MGLYKIPNISQENISKLFKGFNMVYAYIDDVLVMNKDEFKDHPNALEKFLQILTEAGVRLNAKRWTNRN